MRTIKQIFAVVACAAALFITTSSVRAQGQGGGGGRNWDPAAMQKRMTDYIKEQMSITNDDEWKVIEPAITKVMDARREMMSNSMRGFGGRRNRGGDNNSADAAPRRSPFGEPSAEVTDLQKAIDSNASAADIKAKLAKLREANAATEAKLEAAQEDLKKLLSARQEAVAVINGLLK